ncbi:hypothetical protein BC829DRAFT_218525 [Chytridium lagenaria]|nr:hypothetical protein BC829DRAFT_218525 [Chytridium lagenaria]
MCGQLETQLEEIYKRALTELRRAVREKLDVLKGDEVELKRQLGEIEHLENFLRYQQQATPHSFFSVGPGISNTVPSFMTSDSSGTRLTLNLILRLVELFLSFRTLRLPQRAEQKNRQRFTCHLRKGWWNMGITDNSSNLSRGMALFREDWHQRGRRLERGLGWLEWDYLKSYRIGGCSGEHRISLRKHCRLRSLIIGMGLMTEVPRIFRFIKAMKEFRNEEIANVR